MIVSAEKIIFLISFFLYGLIVFFLYVHQKKFFIRKDKAGYYHIDLSVVNNIYYFNNSFFYTFVVIVFLLGIGNDFLVMKELTESAFMMVIFIYFVLITILKRNYYLNVFIQLLFLLLCFLVFLEGSISIHDYLSGSFLFLMIAFPFCFSLLWLYRSKIPFGESIFRLILKGYSFKEKIFIYFLTFILFLVYFYFFISLNFIELYENFHSALFFVVIIMVSFNMSCYASRKINIFLKARMIEYQYRSKTQRKKFLLYLRSFEDDDFKVSAYVFFVSDLFEVLLRRNFDKRINIICYGDPVYLKQKSGVARVYSKHSLWKENIKKEINLAKAIVILIRDTESIRWEINTILEMKCEQKTLFLFRDKSVAESMKDIGLFENIGDNVVGFYFHSGKKIIFHKGLIEETNNANLIMRSFDFKIKTEG